MADYKEMIRLYSIGLNKSDIALSCRCSRNTVIKVIKAVDEKKLEYEKVKDMSDATLVSELFEGNVRYGYQKPDYEKIHSEIQENGGSLKNQHKKYAEDCKEHGKRAYHYTQFKEYYKNFLETTGKNKNLRFKPGEELWICIIDADSGEMIYDEDMNAESVIFAMLPYSGYSFFMYLENNNDKQITKTIRNIFYFIGGIPKLLYCFGINSIISKKGTNDSYRNLACYYNIAIVPGDGKKSKIKLLNKTLSLYKKTLLDMSSGGFKNKQKVRSKKHFLESVTNKFNDNTYLNNCKSRKQLFSEEKAFLRSLPENIL